MSPPQRRIGSIVSGDTDFGTLLAMSRRTSPSVILFRSRNALTADQQAELILSHLGDLTPDLSNGAVVVVSDDRIRIRRLRSYATIKPPQPRGFTLARAVAAVFDDGRTERMTGTARPLSEASRNTFLLG